MDADGDGLVSRPEFQAGKGAVFLAIDEDGSMTLSQNEMRLTPEAFKQLAGDDGVVDGEEFIATDVASFDAIDKNQDHQIDLAELIAYIAKYSRLVLAHAVCGRLRPISLSRACSASRSSVGSGRFAKMPIRFLSMR